MDPFGAHIETVVLLIWTFLIPLSYISSANTVTTPDKLYVFSSNFSSLLLVYRSLLFCLAISDLKTDIILAVESNISHKPHPPSALPVPKCQQVPADLAFTEPLQGRLYRQLHPRDDLQLGDIATNSLDISSIATSQKFTSWSLRGL